MHHPRLLSLLVTLPLAACGGGGGGGGDGGGGAGGSACGDCAYPSKGFDVTVRQGFSADDPVTGRSLPLLARVPSAPGPLPVVVWSHGGGFLDGGEQQSQAWGTTLARHGYVVVHVAHVPVTPDAGLALCGLASIAPADCVVTTDDEDATGIVALTKTRDVIAVLDELPALSAASEADGGPALDLARVAVAGWSAGARAPMVTMGATFEPLPGQPIFGMPDARVVAALAWSPAGPGFGGFYDAGADTSWSGTRGPILFGTGDNDVKPTKPGLNGAVRRQAFDLQPADGQRWLLYSNLPAGVGQHPTYDLEDFASTDERVLSLTAALDATARAFLDAAVLDDPAAQAWLASDAPRLLAGDAEWSNR